MKIKEINYSKSGVISKAAYENLRPGFSVTVEPEESETIEEIFEKLKNIINQQFEMEEYKAKTDLIEKQFSSLKLYPVNGQQYPSITSVLSWNKEWYISEGKLLQYASLGTIVHVVFEDALLNYMKTKKIVWKEPTEYPQLQKEIGILKQGDLDLSWEDCSYKKFAEVYFKDIEEVRDIEKTVINNEIKTAGTLDIVAKIKGKWSLVDLKSGDFDFRQLAFYAITYSATMGINIENMVVFPIGKTDNISGVRKPIIRDNISEEYKEMLRARQEFLQRFGI